MKKDTLPVSFFSSTNFVSLSFRKAYARTFGPLLSAFSKRRKQETFNPKREAVTAADIPTVYTIYDYDADKCELITTDQLAHCAPHRNKALNTWINVDGLRKAEVERLCADFDIHPLLTEDILSTGQRAKADDMDTHLFCLLPMLTYNRDTGLIHTEQLDRKSVV